MVGGVMTPPYVLNMNKFEILHSYHCFSFETVS